MKQLFLTAFALLVLFTMGCTGPASKSTTVGDAAAIFPKGEAGPAENFTGKAWNYGLVASDSLYNTLVGNVYFEPGARSHWHIHPPGQVLVITGGVGYHQVIGQPRQTIRKGNVVQCPPGVEHWHGASPDSGMQQLYIIPNTEKGIVQWLGPVTDSVYNNP